MFDCISGQGRHIVLVVSPLLNLIKDQVTEHSHEIGVKAINISAIEQEEEKQELDEVLYRIIYGTPEA